jgi:ApaG protein
VIETESTELTHGVRVTVQSQYVAGQSSPGMNRFVFAYRVRITNESSEEPVHLQTRHWIIRDQLGEEEEVRGPGVVGEFPRLERGEAFEYTSGAVLKTPRGEMRGSYQMKLPDGSMVDVVIAPFALAMPFTLN